MNKAFGPALFLLLLGFVLRAQDTLTVVFAGDIMGHDRLITSAKTADGYDFSPNYRYIAPYLRRADFVVGNLEVTLPGRPPYKGYPRFRSPDAMAGDLRDAGFDLLLTANNHSNDGGLAGVTHTLDVLDREGLYHTGTFRDPPEREALYPLILWKNDFKLIFLNATYGTNGITTPAPTVVNLIDTAQLRTDLTFARRFEPDFTFMVMHWGKEYQFREAKGQRHLAQQLLHWGADAVVGAHPHVVQPVRYEYSRGDSTRTRGLVAYSLGNFVSDQTSLDPDGGALLEMTLVRENGATRVLQFRSIPIYCHVQNPKSKRPGFFVLPPEALNDEDLLQKLKFTDADRMKFRTFIKRTTNQLMGG